MGWIFGRRKKAKKAIACCLGHTPYLGPEPDWTGPEIEFTCDYSPLTNVVCLLFNEAKKRDSSIIDLRLQKDEHITIKIKGSQESQDFPGLGDYLWSNLVIFLPKFSSIESCKGVITEPQTGDNWRFADFCYAAVDTGYDGWFGEDQFTYRMEPVQAMSLSREFFANIMKKALLIYKRRAALRKAQATGDAGKTIEVVKKILM